MKKNVIITISENHIEKIRSIVDSMHNDGLIVKNVFEFGVITGQVEEDKINILREYPEILSLSEDLPIKISPPEDEIQ